MTSSLWRRGRLLASSDNGSSLFAGISSINAIVSRPGSWVRRRHETSRCVALTADVSEMCPRVQRTDNTKPLFAGTLWKPLTDSNGRPPPYHLTPAATSCNPRQQIWLVPAVSTAGRFAGACHWLRLLGSINAPPSRREIPDTKRGSAGTAPPHQRRGSLLKGGRGESVSQPLDLAIVAHCVDVDP